MDWINLRTTFLRSAAYMGSRPIERATWLNVLAYCTEQENGGRIPGAAAWKDRQWQQCCGVTAREVRSATKLLTIEGDDVLVAAYSAEKEAEVKARRVQAGVASRRRWSATLGLPVGDASGHPSRIPPRNAPDDAPTDARRIAPRNPEGEGEGEYILPTPPIPPPPAAKGEVSSASPSSSNPPALTARTRGQHLVAALRDADGTTGLNLTQSATRELVHALGEILAASPHVTAAEIAQAAAAYRRAFPTATLTAHALAKHWPRLQAPAAPARAAVNVPAEPAGWRDWIAENCPDSPFAPGGDKAALGWSDLDPDHRRHLLRQLTQPAAA